MGILRVLQQVTLPSFGMMCLNSQLTVHFRSSVLFIFFCHHHHMECLPFSDLRIFSLSIPLCEWLTSTPFLLLVHYKYLMNKIKSEMNRESYKVDRIKSKKLHNLRRNKLQVESKVDRNKDTNSNDTGGNTETEKIRERLGAVRRQKNNNRRKLRKHKERKEMDRKKRRKERINNRLKE